MFELTPERIWILIAGVILILAILFFGRPRKPGQGRRRAPREGEAAAVPERVEPTLGEQLEGELAAADAGEGAVAQEELFGAGEEACNGLARGPSGVYNATDTQDVAARAGEELRGSAVAVAAVKVGLVYGYMGVFHRLIEGQPERGPLSSVANIVKPNSF